MAVYNPALCNDYLVSMVITHKMRKVEDTLAMRRIVIALLLVLVCLPVYMMAGHGTVHAAGCYGNSCDNQDPTAMGCAGDAITHASAPIVYDDGVSRPVTYGMVEMRYSAACNAVWTRLTSYVGAQYLLVY